MKKKLKDIFNNHHRLNRGIIIMKGILTWVPCCSFLLLHKTLFLSSLKIKASNIAKPSPVVL